MQIQIKRGYYNYNGLKAKSTVQIKNGLGFDDIERSGVAFIKESNTSLLGAKGRKGYWKIIMIEVQEGAVISLTADVRDTKHNWWKKSVYCICDTDQPLVKIYYPKSFVENEYPFIQGSLRLIRANEYGQYNIETSPIHLIGVCVDPYEYDEF